MFLTHVIPAEHQTGKSWTILAPCDAGGNPDLLDFLQNQPANRKAASLGMLALLLRVSDTGPRHLPDKICHQISEKIWEFIKGDLRIFWFYDDGKYIICSHGLVKKSQKTPKAEILKAESLMAEYVKSKVQNSIIVI